MPAFGKFPTFSAFIENYRRQRQTERQQTLSGLPIALQPEALRDAMHKERDIVEVTGTIQVREPDDSDGDKHYRLRIVIRECKQSDPDIDADLQRCIKDQAQVFIAIRYGDSLGVQGEIPGLDVGASLRLRGEWIPRERAYSHGGEPMSVLHFTHHPIGFICTDQGCYS